MRLHQFTFFAFSALALGCAGGQTGDLSGGHDTGGEQANGGGNCEMHKQKLESFDEMTALGTPEQVLEFAEKTFEAPLTWAAPAPNQTWQVGPESGTSSIHLEVTRGESAYYVTYTPKQNDSGAEIASVGVLCPEPQIGVDVHVELSTEGGALNESFDTLLLAGSTRVATISRPIDFDELSGSLAVTYSDPEVELVQVGLNVTLMPEGMTGSIGGIEQRTQGDAVSASAGRAGAIAVWPDSAACDDQDGDGSGLGVLPDQNALGITGNAAGELLSGTTPVAVTWRDGTETELTLAVEIAGEGCLKISNNYGLDGGENGMATYPATFTLTSEDGRLDGIYSGKLFTYPNGDGSDINAEAFLELPAAQIAESGFPMAEAPSGAHRVAVRLQVLMENGALTEASVALNGLTDPPCVTTPPEPMATPGGGMGSPGCEGTHVTPIESASWND
jgi:hypothetical protein